MRVIYRPMNYRFRKIPVVIEAFHMTRERRGDNSDWPIWLDKAWQKSRREVGAVFPIKWGSATNRVCIRTLEGVMRVNFGDWIIQGVDGELYACKDSIFRKTYEPVRRPRGRPHIFDKR